MHTHPLWRTKIRQFRGFLKRRRRCLGIVLLLNGGLWGIPALYMVIRTPPTPKVSLPNINQLRQSKYDLYVVNWGFHTAILLEQPKGWKLGPPNAPTSRYVEYGWGDKQFFMMSDTSFLTTLAAGIFPTDSVMYLRGRDTLLEAQNYARQLYYRQISAQQLYDLITTLEQSFQRQAGERSMPYPPVPNFKGQFYPGREYYVIWSDCNAWTIRHLQEIEVAHSLVPVIFAEQVGPSLQGFQQIQGTH